MFPLTDSHLHLQDERFQPDLKTVLARAAEAGVRRMVCNGTCEADWPTVAKLASSHAEIIPCFGLHPWYVKTRSANWLRALESFLDSVPSGLGEIGLDQWIKDRDETAQENVFRSQLSLARRKHRPVMIHCLRAWGRLIEVLRSEEPLPAGMLIHAYGGPVELLEELTSMGAYISFAGTVLEEKRTRARAALVAVPEDRLMLETDSPDLLPPTGYRLSDERNEPANMGEILRGVAELRHTSPAILAERLHENAECFLDGLKGHDGI